MHKEQGVRLHKTNALFFLYSFISILPDFRRIAL